MWWDIPSIAPLFCRQRYPDLSCWIIFDCTFLNLFTSDVQFLSTIALVQEEILSQRVLCHAECFYAECDLIFLQQGGESDAGLLNLITSARKISSFYSISVDFCCFKEFSFSFYAVKAFVLPSAHLNMDSSSCFCRLIRAARIYTAKSLLWEDSACFHISVLSAAADRGMCCAWEESNRLRHLHNSSFLTMI